MAPQQQSPAVPVLEGHQTTCLSQKTLLRTFFCDLKRYLTAMVVLQNAVRR